MRREYKVKNENLRGLFEQPRSWQIASARCGTQRSGEHNELADRLVNEALDASR